jgi:hypothetical protein
MTAALDFPTVTAARANLKDILDAADEHLPVTVHRDGRSSAVLDAGYLLTLLVKAVPARAEVVAEADGWSVMLPGLPITGDGPTVSAAVTEVIDALREYAQDWVADQDLRRAVNHRGNDSLVALVHLSTDEQLRGWINGE